MTFAQKRVAINAVIFMPNIFPVGDLWCDLIGVGEFVKLTMAIKSKPEKNQCRDCCCAYSEVASLSIIHDGFVLYADAIPVFQ